MNGETERLADEAGKRQVDWQVRDPGEWNAAPIKSPAWLGK